jgi:hypothetical protein
MKFACFFSCYVLLSCPQYVINADTVMEINSLICFKNRVHSPDENVLILMYMYTMNLHTHGYLAYSVNEVVIIFNLGAMDVLCSFCLHGI